MASAFGRTVLIEQLYLLTTAVMAVAGLAMVGFAIRAYARTPRAELVHLAIGFTLVVGAAVGTAISAFLTGFEGTTSLLAVNNGLTALGYLFVIYCLTSYVGPIGFGSRSGSDSADGPVASD